MTSQGRQYPDGPLLPPSGWFSAESIRKRASAAPAIEEQAWASLGALMASLFGASEPEPGPPYTHTLTGPIPPLPDCKPYRVETDGDG